MDFFECQRRCIAQSESEGLLDEAELFAHHPSPTDQEWADVTKEVVEAGEDVENPYHLMGAYEMRLARRGFKTGLGLAAAEFKETILKVASDAGVPQQHRDGVVQLYALPRTKH